MKKKLSNILVLALLVMALADLGVGAKKVRAASTPFSAPTISFSTSWSEDYWITETNSEHWYKLVVPATGCVTMKMMSYLGGYTYYTLYNQEFSEKLYKEYVYGGSPSEPKTKYTDYVLEKGTYYLKIFNENNYEGKYKIQASYENYRANDQNALSYDSPQIYSLGSQITGAITATEVADWYQITIPNSAYYVINLKSYIGGSTYYTLYNQDLSEKLYNEYAYGGSSLQPKTESQDYVLERGTYYLKISNEYEEGKYIFNLAQLSQSNCSHDYESTDIDATYVSRGYTLKKCKKCGKSYKYNYTVKKVLNRPSFFRFGGVIPGKKKVKLSWNIVMDASGYQIQYCTSKKFKKSVKSIKLKGRTRVSRTVKKLKRKKRYYFRIRAYKKQKGKTVYSKWSSKRRVKIK